MSPPIKLGTNVFTDLLKGLMTDPSLRGAIQEAVDPTGTIQLPVLTEGDFATQTKKEEVRRSLIGLMLQNLRPPRETTWSALKEAAHPDLENMQIRDAILCFTIAFFSDLEKKCHLPHESIKIFAGFLDYLTLDAFRADNGKRFQALLKHLESRFPQVAPILKEPHAESLKQALKFFMSGPEFNGKTFAQALGKLEAKEKPPSENCPYFIRHFQLFMDQTLAVMDVEMMGIQKEFHPSTKRKELAALCKAAKSERCPDPVRETFHDNKLFFERMERLLRVYQARKRIFHEQFEWIMELMGDTSPVLFSAIRQFLDDLSFLKKQITLLKQSCHDRLDLFSSCLSKEQTERIQQEEKPPIFDQTHSPTEEKEALLGNLSLGGNLMKMVLGDGAKTRSLEDSLEMLANSSKLADSFQQLAFQQRRLIEELKRLEEAKQKSRVHSRAEFEKLKKSAQRRESMEELEKGILLSYRLVFQLSVLLQSFYQGLTVLETVLKTLKLEEIKDTSPPSSAFTTLFHPPKKRRQPSIKFDLTFKEEDLPAPQPLPPQEEKMKPSHPFHLQRLFISTLKAPTEFAADSLKHVAHHHAILLSSAHLLRKAIREENTRFLPYLTYATVKPCCIMTEQAITSCLKTDEFSHDHVEMARQINKPADVLEAVRYGTVFHRYPFTSQLFLSEHQFPVPLALQWLLSEKVEFRDLIKLMDSTFSCLKILLPQFPSGDTTSYFQGRPKETAVHPFTPFFRDSLETPISILERCLSKAEKLMTTVSMDPVKAAICGDILYTLKLLKQALECLIESPETKNLSALGDNILTLAQFLDEHIEKLLHAQRFGQLRMIHNLEDYRASRDHQETPEHQRVVAELNIGYGAQYPDRFRHATGQNPSGIAWRMQAIELAAHGKRVDQEAMDEIRGFTLVKKKTKQSPAPQHPVISLHHQLVKIVQGISEMAESRLNELVRMGSGKGKEKVKE